MGNQALVPSQIQSVESYLLDLKTHIQFRSSMGSTTFMKTAKVNLVESYNTNVVSNTNTITSPTSPLISDDMIYESSGDVGGAGGALPVTNSPNSNYHSSPTSNSNNMGTSAATAANISANSNAAIGSTSGSASSPSQHQHMHHHQQQQLAPTAQPRFNQPNAYRLKVQQFLRDQQQIVVVKIFPRYDLTIRLDPYSKRVKEIKNTIYSKYGPSGTNCLPYSELVITDRAVFLFRQYVKYNLYDRLSTRPFLTIIEKKWIAFQLLCAVNECHSLQIVHGDIKTENVLVNSFLWAQLADFASYKPVYLSKNHPTADFNYYFDISRRRTCYLAPERFDQPNETQQQSGTFTPHHQHTPSMDMPMPRPPDPVEFRPAMDIFSLGCVIAELFMERPLFDFAQLLAYRDHKYDPRAELRAEVGDQHILDMILSMISLEPSERKTANQYLIEQNDRAFPSYFVFLRNYISRFVGGKMSSSDEIVTRLKADLPILLKNLKLNMNNENDSQQDLTASACETLKDSNSNNNDAFLILLPLLLSCIRKIKYAENKLIAIDLMSTFSRFLADNVILDRVVPYYLCMLESGSSSTSPSSSSIMMSTIGPGSTNASANSTSAAQQPVQHFQQPPIVKAHVIYALNDCLANIVHIDVNNVNIFAELIFETLDMLARDESYLVRSTVAKCIGSFALTSLRYLDMSFLSLSSSSSSNENGFNSQNMAGGGNNSSSARAVSNYDKEHEFYQSKITDIVMQLMTSADASSGDLSGANSVKETLIRSQIGRLCSFFGRSRTTEFLLPHMITILNEKTDWSIRAAFFDALATVLACIGWESVDIVKSLLEQGLRDSEEFVIQRTLCCLCRMVELGLLDKTQIIYFLSAHVIPLLCHPSLWIRHGAVGFISAVCRSTAKSSPNGLNTVDVLCSVVPMLNKFLKPSSTDLVQFDEPAVLFASMKKPVSRQVYDTIAQDGRADQLFVYLIQRSEIRALNIFNTNTSDNNQGGANSSVTSSTTNTNTNYLPSYIDCADQAVQELFEDLCRYCQFVEEDEDKLLHMREFLDKQRISRLSSSLHYNNINGSSGANTGNMINDSMSTNNPAFIELSNQIQSQRMMPRTQWALLNGRNIKTNSSIDVIPGSPSSSNLSSAQNQANSHPIQIDKYLDKAKFVYDDHAAKQFRTIKFREAMNLSLSSNIACLSSQVSRWKPRGYLVLDSREHTKEINRLVRNSNSTYFASCSTSESCVKIWSIEHQGIWDSKSGFYKSCYTYDRAASQHQQQQQQGNSNSQGSLNNDESGFRPSCISFYDKNTLGILCEDFRFYAIDFNSTRTQYLLYHNEKLFRSNGSLVCNCGASRSKFNKNSFDKVKFYYLNKQWQHKSLALNSPKLGCTCTNNYPIEMIRLEETSPAWSCSVVNMYDYFNYSPSSSGTAALSSRRSSSAKGLFCYSTSHGTVSCIDMRIRAKAFDLTRDLKRGYVTSMITDPWCTWIAMGTSTGNIEVYDFRFMVPVQTFEHRSRTSVVRMCNHPNLNSRICASYQGNNELAIWNMEKNEGSLTKPEFVFWGVQSVPPLCQNKMQANAYISGLAACTAYGEESNTNGLICASTDMRIRYIDLNEPTRDSFIISSAFNVQPNATNSGHNLQHQHSNQQQSAGLRTISENAGGSSNANSNFASNILNNNGAGGNQITYEMRLIEGTRVLIEQDPNTVTSSTTASSSTTPTSQQQTQYSMPALTHQSYFTHHQDAITDLCVCYNKEKNQPILITAARDGCLKIWK